MTLFYKSLESITKDDLDAMIRVESELKTIEFKLKLPELKGTDTRQVNESKKEFLRDVSSFANSLGGDILYGVRADKGEVTAIPGLEMTREDADRVIGQLESVILDGIRPRIPVQFQPLWIGQDKAVLILRVYKGLMPPHQISFDKDFLFWTRLTTGKQKMDVDQLRTTFELSSSLRDRIRNFRMERLSDIMAGDSPIPLLETPKIVFHVIPVGAFESPLGINIDLITSDEKTNYLPFISGGAFNRFHNYDGYIQYASDKSTESAYAYTQLFRTGIIESVDARLIQKPERESAQYPYIPALYESQLIKVLDSFLETQRKLGVDPPILIGLSLLGVKGHIVVFENRVRTLNRPIIRKNNLLLPEIEINTFDCDAAEVLKPIFDIVANAGGWSSSPNYGDDGKRTIQ